VIVNVCPAATTKASLDRIWSVLTDPQHIHEWNDASYVSADPPGPMTPGQVIHLTAPEFGRTWPVKFDVRNVDRQKRWLDVVVHLPFGIENHERITLTETADGGTLVRFN